MAVVAENALELMAGIVGADHVRESAAEIASVRPGCEVAPASAEETAAVLRSAAEHGFNVVPAGGMTKQGFGHGMPQIDVLLSARRLNKLVFYDPGDLTIGVGAGATIAEVQERLAAHGQFLPFSAMRPQRATVGGVLAANAHGPLKHFYGGVRDYCIGIEFATTDGKVVKGGGRVVKNVAGFDHMKLLIGSHGTLGVITSANFKVFPAPRQTRTFVARCTELREAIEFRNRVMRSVLTPQCVEVLSPQAPEYLAAATPARDPDTYAPASPVERRQEWQLCVRAAGSERVLQRYKNELAGAEEISGKEEAGFWAGIADFEANVMARHHNAMILHVSIPPNAVQRTLEAAARAALDNSCTVAIVGRAAAGALVVAVIPLAIGPPSAMHYANAASAIRAALPKDASAIVARCPTEAKQHFEVWGSTPTDLEMMRRVRSAMDPKGTLNRGRFLA